MAETLSGSAPMLCERCFSPVLSLGYLAGGHAKRLRHRLGSLNMAVRVTDWPGTDGLAVWFHSRCYLEELS